MNDKPKRVAAKFIDELPPGDWTLRAVGDVVIAVCKDYPPRVYRDGKYDGELKP